MSSAPPTPSRQPSRSSSMWKAVRRATLLGGGAGSKESSRPGTPAGGSSTNLALPESATAPATATPSKDAASKDGGGSGSKDGNGNGNGNNGGGKKPEDDDAASIKSGKSSKGSLAGRFLSRSGSVSSLRNLGRRKSMDTSSKHQSQQPSALNTSTGGLAPPAAANPAVAGLMVPSPIAESPNREAMETAPFVAPGSLPTTSPLAHEVSRGSEADSLPQPVSGSDRSSASGRGETESPTGYVHPPLLDSAAGNPGAFTDDSDMLPQPVVIPDPYGVAGRSRSRVDLSLPAVVPESREGGGEGEGEGSESLPNPHEQRESSLPNPHEEGVGAPRGLEGGPSVSAVSTAATDYGVEVERSGGVREAPPFLRADTSTAEGSEDGGLVESPSSHTGFAAAVEGHAALARGKGGVEEGEGYGYGSGMRDGKGTEERGREPTLPAYSESDGTPLDNPFVDLQSQPRSAYQPQVSQPQVAQPQVFQSPPFAPISQPQAQYPTQGQSQYHDDDDDDYPEQDSATKRAYAPSPPVPQNTLANVPPQWPVEEHIAANPQWDDGVDSPTRVLRSDSPPQIPDSFDEPRGRDQPLGQSKQGEQEGYSQRQGTQGSDFYIPPPSPPPVSRGKGSMGGLGMPQPQHPTTQVMPIESHRDEHPTILMPLPPFNSVVAAQPLVQPSTRPQQAGYETDESRPLLGGGANTTKPPIATYGIRPANSTDSAWVPTASSSTRAAGIYSLPRRYGSTTSFRNYDSGHGQPRGGGATLGVVEGYGPNVNPKLHDLGWVEYHLPDGTSYYVHPTLRVTTDVNLRSERLLDDVTDWLDMNPPFGTSGVGAHPGYGATDGSLTGTGTGKRSSQMGAGVEVWLRDAKSVTSAIGSEGRKKRRDTGASDVGRYVRCWVDHQARTVVLEKLSGTSPDRKGKGKLSKKDKGGKGGEDEEEDELDMAFRYWSFTEAHPAHMVLSPQSRNEALEVLTWAYTDRILPSQKPVPPPFGPSECDELRKLINSFPADSPDDNGIQTRVVARVLLRVASWRQAHFRSHKPLPKDVKPVPPTSLAGRRASAVGKSVLRLVWDLFVVLVCLGLPYIFVEKRNRDEEGWHGELRTEGSGGSIFAVGVISCLVSAVILSASVTFLTLPGMTGAARIAGFVAISCAVGSMLASTIAFIRFRNEFSGVVDRTSINHRIVGGEGLVGISNRAVVNSLPLVFVAYSVIGFVVGLTIYSFRGTDLDGPSSSSPADTGLSAWVFGQGAKWSALGLLGAAGGVVAMSWVVWKQ